MTKCKVHPKYKAIHPPRSTNKYPDGCPACSTIYLETKNALTNKFWLGDGRKTLLKAIRNEAEKHSQDRSTKVGCAIYHPRRPDTTVFGFNSFPAGCNTTLDERHARPAKYKWTEHAERNAIYYAACEGIQTAGAIMFLPWYTCADCARAVIQAGIIELVCYEPNWDDPTWGEDFRIAAQMFTEAGVKQTFEEKVE